MTMKEVRKIGHSAWHCWSFRRKATPPRQKTKKV